MSTLSKFLTPIYGADSQPGGRGYNAEADVVRTTIDGIDLNALWAEFQQSLSILNEYKGHLMSLLTFPVGNPIESVTQVGEAEFELASEYGIPQTNRVEMNYFSLGYDFHDYDTRVAFTWKFLRDADARQVEAIHQKNIDADRALMFRKVMEAIFDNRNRNADIRGQNYTVYALYNGDGTVPPSYKGENFDGTHSHYLTSGNVLVDSGDLEDLYEEIAEHGYGIENGTKFVFLCNKAEIREIRKFRQGQVNNNGAVAQYDFIPAPNQPALIVPNAEGLLGSQPASEWNGLPVTGSYGDILIIEESFIPQGYGLMFGTGGAGDLQNLVGMREHVRPEYQGLRLLPGNQQRYPLGDSYYSRSFGTGIRQRAGAAVMQFTASTTYTIPEKYKKGSGLK